MFIFISRVGRLAVGIPVVIAITTILGLSTFTEVPVAYKHHALASAGCTISATTVGAPMSISGAGYQPGTSLEVIVVQPNGNSPGYATWTNSLGNFNLSSVPGASGSYVAHVYSTSGNKALLATCSASVA